MALPVIEIIRRSEQGATRPYLVRVGDGALYFAKGRAAGRRDLICEAVCAELARRFELPVPAHAILEVPQALIDMDPTGLRDLGSGPVFGSRYEQGLGDLLPSQVAEVPPALQRAVAVFDGWVCNADRTLTERGGNPNLLWRAQSKALIVIDHNQAFDRTFDPAVARLSHVFALRYAELASEPALRTKYSACCRLALAGFDAICDNLPPGWWYLDDEQTVPTPFERAEVKVLLDRYRHDDFWSFK